MKYTESLRKNNDFQKVYKTGTSFANRNLVMYVKENDLSVNRLGISVSKKVGNSVIRHRLKRLIKEAYRLNEDMFHRGIDVVVIARVNAKNVDYSRMKDSLLHVAGLHHIVETEKDEKSND